jgi:hypothetical protein
MVFELVAFAVLGLADPSPGESGPECWEASGCLWSRQARWNKLVQAFRGV